MTDPTHAEIQRVHEYECKLHGHYWSFAEVMGCEFPVAIYCTRCGVRAKVVPA